MRTLSILSLALAGVSVPFFARAHVSLASGPTTANVSRVVVFGVGHGCEVEGTVLDTTSVRVEIPAGVTSVRPVLSGFDQVGLETDDTGAVVAVTWSKDQAQSEDIAYYQLELRLKAPDKPFSVLQFPAYQTCNSPDGDAETVALWTALEEGEGEHEGEPGPAPSLVVLPARLPGWNKYTVDEDIEDLETFFADAQIVWQGKAAYSINSATVELISDTDGVSSLEKIESGEEFWVKY